MKWMSSGLRITGCSKKRELRTSTFTQHSPADDLSSPDGASHLGGHSLRVTGAQALARAGVDLWAIQLLVRWGSSAVLGYVQAVPLERSSSWARRAAQGLSLEQVVAASSAAPSSSTSPSAAAPTPAAVCSDLPAEAGPSACLEEALVVEVQASAVAASDAGATQYVRSGGGLWHRTPAGGLGGSLPHWSTACGWRFAAAASTLRPELPHPVHYKALCSRCLPLLRDQLKDNCGLAVSGV